jgi:hypothetical protein
MKPALLPILVVVLVQNAICGSKDDPQPENATVAVLRAFTNHDVVMVGEIHSNNGTGATSRGFFPRPCKPGAAF